MSTDTKTPLARMAPIVEDFTRLFPAACFKRWEVAGSFRRRSYLVGDLEFCIIPAMGEAPTGDLLGSMEVVNLLWRRVDELVSAKVIERVETDTAAKTRACWGEKQRRVRFRGIQCELYTADERSWGAILAIRTGPAGLSKYMVEQIRKQTPPYCMAGGYVRKLTGKPKETDEPIVDCPTEQMYFGLCGMHYLTPESRKD